MPCYSPLRACLVEGPQGRRLEFGSKASGKALSLPCGRCIGCRLERSRQWAVRIMHEAKMHEVSCFLTLTYDPEHLPKDGSLSVDECQRFLKRLRARIAPTRVRFFLCGEYGEVCELCGEGRKVCLCPRPVFGLGRPHYHAILFGYDFPDRVLVPGARKHPIFSSSLLSETWGNGFASIGSVSFDSAAYVANYATKKVTGEKAQDHYRGRRPEFLLMSRRPGIGRTFVERYVSDVYPSDTVVVKGVVSRPPRYYQKVALQLCWQSTADLLARREAEAERLEEYVLKSGDRVFVAPGRNARRLAVRKLVAEAKAQLKSRSMETQ